MKQLDKIMLIAIEGCIGAGKSTVAEGLAAYRKSDTLFESFEDNPFLSDFYKNPKAFATETEFTFLLLHFHQLKKRLDVIGQNELIADFHLGKDLIFADLNFYESEIKRVFNDLFELLQEQLPEPALIICLSASTNLIIERIRKRKRNVELEIDPDYYAKVNAEYEKFFVQYEGRKLLISMDEWDFVNKPELFHKLSIAVDDQLKPK